MKKNQNQIEEEVEKKYVRRDKKKRLKIKVSGKNVFKLKDIIKKKGQRKK